ncbi:GNAT family N-acetyltransferase [Microlunatus flavus]|uniref:Acetyltransferase (GNAT) family protein n=1 Tax=Microlunatus flavus TaxID=1036181 RepID=A0A1H9JJJ8_9ACTN|nr:GNAT family N-acetyltransferase [Microlunatus flavus]SEQ87016.1 Acetyltransferase (GNAT) family protein [Microlunatus flavus]
MIVDRDGPDKSASVVERAYEAFGRQRLRFAVVGAVPVAFGLTLVKEPGVALLSRLCVDPSTTSRGLGSALVADAIEHAAASRFARVELQVRETNIRAMRV